LKFKLRFKNKKENRIKKKKRGFTYPGPGSPRGPLTRLYPRSPAPLLASR
jgi:hypothetical protein